MNLKYLWATLQFITRIPVPARWSEGTEFQEYRRGVPYFPVAGLIVGIIAALLTAWIDYSTQSPLIAALGYVFALMLLTGGFHLDGLADTCDGIFSARKRERMLEIMRDSRIGTHGCLALVFALMAKSAAAYEVLMLHPLSLMTAAGLLICAPVAGRTCMSLLMYNQRYAREGEGMGNIYIGRISLRRFITTLATGAVIVTLLGGMKAFGALIITAFIIYGLGRYFCHHLGGQTGDTLGAAEECGEILFLLALFWM
ncbi:MAG TPA: adenosylcobinamide-GDP ribazoletransferase [Morganella sp. (in: Bacteria)]|nr:adenosylcobinamide-GDP ribazoletransferase [Morganella sp. (in: enterobacteria)]